MGHLRALSSAPRNAHGAERSRRGTAPRTTLTVKHPLSLIATKTATVVAVGSLAAHLKVESFAVQREPPAPTGIYNRSISLKLRVSDLMFLQVASLGTLPLQRLLRMEPEPATEGVVAYDQAELVRKAPHVVLPAGTVLMPCCCVFFNINCAA